MGYKRIPSPASQFTEIIGNHSKFLARGQVKEVAEELGIDPQLLSTWKYQFRNDKDIAFPGNGKKKRTPQEEENAMLRKELADARLERDILKKAISIFSSSDRKNMRS